MALRGLTGVLALASSFFSLTAASPPGVEVRTHNAPGQTNEDTHLAIRRGLAEAKLQKREELSGNTTLDRSWDGAVLLKMGSEQEISTSNSNASLTASQSVEIVCTTCYIKGLAKAVLNIPDNFDAGATINATANELFDEIHNFTETIEDYLGDYFDISKFADGIQDEDFILPPLNYSFDVDVPAIPEVTLDFEFDGMELYLQTNTILGAALAYELNLYTSNTPIGIGLGKDMTLGVVFKVDLLLKAEGSINIASGLHIKLEDGVKINIALFGEDVSDIVFNGGKFEFLPVTVESAGVVLTATLRIGIHSGIALTTPSTPKFTVLNETLGLPALSGGIEVAVFANIAEFITNVTIAPNDPKCELKVVQEYQIALGAKAGASVALVDSVTWGPVAETSIPIWSTEIAEICAIKATQTSPATVSATSTAKDRKREDLSTTSTELKIVHTGVQCISSVAGNCPMSMQSTTKSVETITLSTEVPSGQEVKWPATPGVADAVTSTVAFGSDANTFTATSGSPTSYTPPPKETGKNGDNPIENALNGEVGGVSKKVIVGVSVGVGVPLIAAIMAAIILIRRRKRYNAVPSTNFTPGATPLINETYGHSNPFDTYMDGNKPKMPRVNVSEVRY